MKAEKETNKKTGNNRFRDPKYLISFLIRQKFSRSLCFSKVAWRSLRKALMVTPSDTWPRPPPFIGGGIRWARCPRPNGEFWAESSDYYQIVWSSEYEKVTKRFAPFLVRMLTRACRAPKPSNLYRLLMILRLWRNFYTETRTTWML